MKKITLSTLVVISVFLQLSSCGKKSSPTCRIVTVTSAGTNNTTTYNITYNSDGRLSTRAAAVASMRAAAV